MYFSGITEAYDYQTPEGWWVIYVTFPDEIFRVWLEDFPYDCCVSEVSDKIKYDWDFTILIKDPVAYLHFKSRWQTDYEYTVCRGEHDTLSAYSLFKQSMPDTW